MTSFVRLSLIFISLFFVFQAKSQTCGTCSINITSLDSADYTVNSGQTFCIDTTGNFIGTISLNGGTICNRGIFFPKTIQFGSGTITNYGNTSLNTSISLNTNTVLNNNVDAVMNINGVLTIIGGTLNNGSILNIDQNIQLTSGSLINSSIINCTVLSGGGNLNNTGKINVN